MGKKKIVQKTQEEILKESELLKETISRQTEEPTISSKKLNIGNIYIRASYNNTIVTVADVKGNVIAWASAGSLGFSGPKKATPFAASKVIEAIAEKIRRIGPQNLHIFIQGVGGGRESAIRSLANRGFNILSIQDITPVPHNGPRPKKVRRV
mgnify:FL=1